MSWHEVDLDKALWTIPPERMKGDAAHEVPYRRRPSNLEGTAPLYRAICVYDDWWNPADIAGFPK